MKEYIIYLRTKSGDTYEVQKYTDEDEYYIALTEIRRILDETEGFVALYDIFIHVDEISVIKGEEIPITLS